jgi:hypothetical protein
MDFPLFILVILCAVCWILYNSNQILQKTIFNLEVENSKLELKVNYLQSYKDDVSKTFKILDNELVSIKQTLLPSGVHPRVSRNFTFPETDPEGPSSIFSNIFNTFLNGGSSPTFGDDQISQPQEPEPEEKVPKEKVPEQLEPVDNVTDRVEKELNERESFGSIPTQYDQFKI